MGALHAEKGYTIDDINALPEDQHAELIDGDLFMISAPTVLHQRLSGGLYYQIRDHIYDLGKDCEVFSSPFAVFLNGLEDEYNYFEPDIIIICDPGKTENGNGCDGAPDWIIEITSPSTEKRDMGVKLFKYRNAGVKEYWVVNPLKKIVNVFLFGNNPEGSTYTFDEAIPVGLCTDFTIRIADL